MWTPIIIWLKACASARDIYTKWDFNKSDDVTCDAIEKVFNIPKGTDYDTVSIMDKGFAVNSA